MIKMNGYLPEPQRKLDGGEDRAFPMLAIHSEISFVKNSLVCVLVLRPRKSCTTRRPCQFFLGLQKIGELNRD